MAMWHLSCEKERLHNGGCERVLIYQDDNGVSNVNVRFEGEDVWLTAEQLQQLFQASQQDVNHHIQQIGILPPS